MRNVPNAVLTIRLTAKLCINVSYSVHSMSYRIRSIMQHIKSYVRCALVG